MDTDQPLAGYLERITTHFPEVPLDNARLISKGWDNDVVILDDAIVFRFPKREGYLERFRSEVKLLRYLQPKLSIPVPNYMYFPEDLDFSGYPLITGVELTPEVLHNFSAKQKEQIAEQLGNFLSVVHATPIDTVSEFGFAMADERDWRMKTNVGEVLQALRENVFPKLEKEEVRWIEHQFSQYASLSFDFHATVIHSDFGKDHIFVDPFRGVVTGVIDFADTEICDPAYDFSGLWCYGNEFPIQVSRYYKGEQNADLLSRSKFPSLVRTVVQMLNIEDKDLPITFEGCRQQLREQMNSGVSL